jgi:hypothetical protein
MLPISFKNYQIKQIGVFGVIFVVYFKMYVGTPLFDFYLFVPRIYLFCSKGNVEWLYKRRHEW